MPQKQNYFEVWTIRAARAANFYFIFQLFWVEFFFINSSQSSKSYAQLEKVLRHMEFTREILKDQLHLLKSFLQRCS
jgi:cell division protein FtsB